MMRFESSQPWATSSGSLHVESGPGMTLWAAGDSIVARSPADISLELQLHQLIVIGRQEGGEVPYLDPQFRPTRMVSDTGQCVLKHEGHGRDIYVSRGHFVLRGHSSGILLINGVPRRGGGIRPPLNGTRLVAPAHRSLRPGEELLIQAGLLIKIELPNGTVFSIEAD
jgi:hypothetical protein